MKIIFSIIKVLILIILIILAWGNTNSIAFSYFPGYPVEVPLIVALAIAFLLGAILGALALTGRLFGARRSNAKLRRELKEQVAKAEKAEVEVRALRDQIDTLAAQNGQ